MHTHAYACLRTQVRFDVMLPHKCIQHTWAMVASNAGRLKSIGVLTCYVTS